MSHPKLKITSDFPDPVDTRILEQICRVRDDNQVCLRRFQRFGFSGARLLLVYFARKPEGIPYLLKIADLDKVKEEHKGIRSMTNFVKDARVEHDRVFEAALSDGTSPKRKWGGLLYTHQGTDQPANAASPVALRQILFVGEDKCPTDHLVKIVEKVFDRLQSAHQKTHVLHSTSAKRHFERYLRGNRSAPRIECLLGPDSKKDKITFLSAPIHNPLRLIGSLSAHTKMISGRVHGDLHADNIVMDQDDIPHLIDFAWSSEPRDVLVDFALLETSIRFMAFPRPMNLDSQLVVDNILLRERGWEDILDSKFRTACAVNAYRRLARVVGVIRSRARRVIGTRFSMQRYLVAQFFLLYGLLAYESYESYVGTRALGMIAREIERNGLP